MPVAHCLHYFYSNLWNRELWVLQLCSFLGLFLPFWITGILIEIMLNLWISLRSIAILIILSLPFHRHGINKFHLCRSLISFNDLLQFSECKFYTSFIKCIPKYFILHDAIVNGIAFLILFSSCNVLVMIFLCLSRTYCIFLHINQMQYISLFIY